MQTSPVVDDTSEKSMSFTEMISPLMFGEKITAKEWGENEYIYLVDGVLKIHINEKDLTWEIHSENFSENYFIYKGDTNDK